MKKAIVMLFLITAALLIVTNALAEEITPFVFRDGVMFGMTMDAVKALESTDPFYEDESWIVYENQLAANQNAEILYGFSEDPKTLVNIGVVFTDSIPEPDELINEFATIDQSLIQKYGEVTTAGYEFYDATYSDNPDDYPLALMLGHVKYHSQWSFDEFLIDHELYRQNNDVMIHVIWYSHK